MTTRTGGAAAGGGAGRLPICCSAADARGSRESRASTDRRERRPQADPCRPIGSWGAGRPPVPDSERRAPPFQSKAKPETRMKGGCPPLGGGDGARRRSRRAGPEGRRQSRPCGLATARRGLGRQPGRGASHPGSLRHRSVSAAGAPAHPPGSWPLLTYRDATTTGPLHRDAWALHRDAEAPAVRLPAADVTPAPISHHTRATLT